jgi:epoxyqueuosine reductase
MNLLTTIGTICQAQGLSSWAILPVPLTALSTIQTGSVEEDRHKAWLTNGLHGEMQFLDRNADKAYHPELVMAGCRSLLLVTVPYFQNPPESITESVPFGAGAISVYAWGRDYHKTLPKKLRAVSGKLSELFPNEQFRTLADASPLQERYFAQLAGLGFTGRHTLLITPRTGSYVFLGTILTTMALPILTRKLPVTACPTSCRRCADICPTQALSADGMLDARRCIAYLTIEHSGPIPLELRPLLGDWLFGCDLCQQACPFNFRVPPTTVTDFLALRAGPRLSLTEVLAIPDDQTFIDRFGGTALMRAGRVKMIRNACVVAANTKSHDCLDLLREHASGSDQLIAEHAQWAVDQLSS